MKVLVVEDEHKIANSIKKGLEQEKYTVDTVYSGTEGLDLGITEPYDIIILDRLLPGIDGVKITQKLRDANIHTPIIILTARGQTEDKIEGLDSGADDYMTKPFAFTELLARIRALTRRPSSVVKSELKVADLTLNSSTFEVRRNNKSITLSQKEFALLEFLMRHQNSIVTKEQIINHVWSYDSDVLPNSVEVYIKHLRDKVEKNKKPLIHTVRGFGYKMYEE
jgi:DNA-binding response OmpR family regulator